MRSWILACVSYIINLNEYIWVSRDSIRDQIPLLLFIIYFKCMITYDYLFVVIHTVIVGEVEDFNRLL